MFQREGASVRGRSGKWVAWAARVTALVVTAASLGGGVARGVVVETDASVNAAYTVPSTSANLLYAAALTPTPASPTSNGYTLGTWASLTNGDFGAYSTSLFPGYAPGVGIYNGNTLIYALDTSTNVNGYNITAIDTYTGGPDGGRVDQSYTVSCSTVAAPSTFTAIKTVNYASGSNSTHVNLVDSSGTLATGIKAIKFVFNTQENGWTSWREISVAGSPVVPAWIWNVDAAGTWGTAGNWSLGSVPNSVGASVTFGSKITTSRTITLNLPATVGSIVLNNANRYTLDGASPNVLTLQATTGSATIVNGSGSHEIRTPVSLGSNLAVTVANGSDKLTLSGAVDDGGAGKGVSVSGLGTLVLGNAGNNYGGPTTVNAGTLKLAASGAIPDGAGKGDVAISAGAALDLGGFDETINGLSGGGIVTSVPAATGVNTLSVGGNDATSTFSGIIQNGSGGGAMGTIALTKIGAGTLTLAGNNTYTGTTTVSAGTLKAGSASALGLSASGAAVQNGGTLDIGGQLLSPKAVTATGVGANGDGAVINTGSQQVQALGALVLAGDTTLGGTGRWDVRGSTTMYSPGSVNGNSHTLTKVGANFISFYDCGATDLGDIVVNGGTLSFEQSSAMNGAGYTATVNSGGTLAFWDNAAANNDKNLALGPGSTLQIDGGITHTTSLPGTVTLDGASTIFTNSAGDLAINGKVTGSGGFNKTGARVLTLANAGNDYRGGTTLSAGTLVLGSATALGAPSGSLTVAGGTLDLGGFTPTISGAISLQGGTVANGMINNTGADYDAQSGAVSAVLAGSVAVNKTTDGTLVLSGTNTYSGGTTLAGGTLSVSADRNLGAASGPLTFNGGTLQVTGTGFASVPSARLLTWGAGGGGLDIADPGATFTMDRALTGGGLTKAGPGKLVLSTANSYGGDTTVSAGTLVVGAAGAIPSGAGSLAVGMGATLDMAGVDVAVNGLSGDGTIVNHRATPGSNTLTVGQNDASSHFSGVIRDGDNGILGFVKTGAGTLTLTSANAYSGPTTIHGGTLQLGMPISSDFAAHYSFDSVLGNTVVNDGAMLDKNGTIDTVYATTTNPGVQGNCLSLASAGGFMQIDNGFGDLTGIPLTSGAYTVSAWFSGLSGSADWKTLFRGSGGNGDSLAIVDGGFSLGFYGINAGGNFASSGYSMASLIGSSRWHQLTVVANGTTSTYYLDGQQVGLPVNKVSATNLWAVGADWGGTVQQFASNLDEVYVYERALDPAEVLALYTGTAGAGGVSNYLPDTSPISLAAGATLSLAGGSETIGPLSGAGNVALSGGALTVNSAGATPDSAFSGVISGTGGLTKTGPGAFTLNGANPQTYTGPTQVLVGKLTLDFGNMATPTDMLPSSSAVTLAGGRLAIVAKSGSATSQTVAGLTLNAGASAVQVTNTGAGTSGNLTLGEILRNAGATVDFTLPANGSVTTATGNTPGNILGGWATVGGATWAQSKLGGTIQGFAAYESGPSAFTVLEANVDVNVANGSPSGNASVSSLRFNDSAAVTLTLGAANTLSLSSAGILVTANVGTHASTITGGALSAATDLVVVQNNSASAGTLTINSAIAAAGLTKTGPGRLVLGGSNVFTGPVTINTGTLALAGGDALNGATELSFGPGSTGVLQLNGYSATVGGIATYAGNGGSPAVENGGAGTSVLTVNNAADATFAITLRDGSGSGALGLAKSGAAALTVAGNNAFTGGVTINDTGVLQIGSAAALNSAGSNSVTFGSGSAGVLRLAGHSITVSGLSTADAPSAAAVENAHAAAATLTINAASPCTFAGALRDGAGGGALSVTKTGPGALTLLGANSYTGATTVNAGTLQGNDTSIRGNIQLSNHASVVFDQAIDGAYARTIAGSGGLTKTGVAALALMGNNTYDGPTSINGGALLVGVTLPAGSAAYYSFDNVSGSTVINDGALADKNGTISNAAVASGGIQGNCMVLSNTGGVMLIDNGSGGIDTTGVSLAGGTYTASA